MIHFLEQATGLLSKLCITIASAAMVVLIVTFGWLVFGRYVLNVTPTWVEQLALVLICYIAFLGAAAGVQNNNHLGVTLFRDMLPALGQKLVIIVIDVILAVFGAVMFLAGVELMQFGWDSYLPMLNVPESVRTAAITTCGGLVCLFAGSRALLRILKFSGDWHVDAAPQEQ